MDKNDFLKDTYKADLLALRDKVMAQLKDKGLHVEHDGDYGISISLTQFGLSTMYATVTQDELEYFLDNEIEL